MESGIWEQSLLLHYQLILAVNCLDRKTELVRGRMCSPWRDTNHSGISAFRVGLLSASELSSAESSVLLSWILFHFGKRWPVFCQNLLSQAFSVLPRTKQPCTRRLGWISEKPLARCCPVPVLYLPVIHSTPRGDDYYCKTSVVW